MAALPGSGLAGIGTPGSVATPSFLARAFFTVRLDGPSTLHLRSTEPRSFTEATGVARISSATSIIPMGTESNHTADFAALSAASMGPEAFLVVDSVGLAEAVAANAVL